MLRLTINLDGRFVYETLLYSIAFLPTHVWRKRKGREWVLTFNLRRSLEKGFGKR